MSKWRITAEVEMFKGTYAPLIPVIVEASSLRDALQKAQEVPFPDWFPDEDDDERSVSDGR